MGITDQADHRMPHTRHLFSMMPAWPLVDMGKPTGRHVHSCMPDDTDDHCDVIMVGAGARCTGTSGTHAYRTLGVDALDPLP